MRAAIWKRVCEIGCRWFSRRGSPIDVLISFPTYDEVQERTIHNLESAPFYAGLLKHSVLGHLRRCTSPWVALRSRVIRRLYLESDPWVRAGKRNEQLVPRILHPERAFPRF